MYGLITQLNALQGRRDELAAILAAGSRDMPGCISYVVAKDTGRDDAIWVCEVWTDKVSHQASLQLPAVQSAMQRGRSLIAGIGVRVETGPITA